MADRWSHGEPRWGEGGMVDISSLYNLFMSAAEKLEITLNQLVSITALRQAIARAGALNQSDYTVGSWTDLVNILARGKYDT